jgi:hypothetical protein
LTRRQKAHTACSCGRVWLEGPGVAGTLPPCTRPGGCKAVRMCASPYGPASTTLCELPAGHTAMHRNGRIMWAW